MDQVRISSDAELRLALAEMPGPVYRLTLDTGEQLQPAQQQNIKQQKQVTNQHR